MHEGLQGMLDSTKESTSAEIAHRTAVCKVITHSSACMHLVTVLDSTKESTTAEIAHLTAVCKVTTQPSMRASIHYSSGGWKAVDRTG